MHRKLTVVTLILAAVLLPALGAYGDISLNDELIDAARDGDCNRVESLLKAGADANAKSEYGWTTLMEAAESGHVEVAELLLKHGADVNAKNENHYGWTALKWAAGNGHTKVVEVLLKHGANVNQKDNFGNTALMEAALQGNIEVVNILIREGAYVNARSKDGKTALMRAAYGEDNKASEIVSILIEAGAHINTKVIAGVNKGWSAVMFAEFQGNTKTVSILRKAGALGKLTPKQRDDYIEFLRAKSS